MPSGTPVDSAPSAAADAGRQRLERRQRQRLAVDGVAAEQLVGALAGEHHLDVLAGLAGDEVQRHERRVGDRVVEVPDDQRDGVGELLRR